MSSSVISRDRDVCAHPLLGGGWIQDLAGQASHDDMGDHTHLIHVDDIITDLENPRDRDTRTAPPPEGGSVLIIAGQASNVETTFESNLNRLQHIYDSTTTIMDSLVLKWLSELNVKQGGDATQESANNQTAGNDTESVLLMVKDEEVLRTLEIMRAITIETAEDSNDNDAEMAEQQDHERELSQMSFVRRLTSS